MCWMNNVQRKAIAKADIIKKSWLKQVLTFLLDTFTATVDNVSASQIVVKSVVFVEHYYLNHTERLREGLEWFTDHSLRLQK